MEYVSQGRDWFETCLCKFQLCEPGVTNSRSGNSLFPQKIPIDDQKLNTSHRD